MLFPRWNGVACSLQLLKKGLALQSWPNLWEPHRELLTPLPVSLEFLARPRIEEANDCSVVGVMVARAPEPDPPEPSPDGLPPQDVVRLG